MDLVIWQSPSVLRISKIAKSDYRSTQMDVSESEARMLTGTQKVLYYKAIQQMNITILQGVDFNCHSLLMQCLNNKLYKKISCILIVSSDF